MYIYAHTHIHIHRAVYIHILGTSWYLNIKVSIFEVDMFKQVFSENINSFFLILQDNTQSEKLIRNKLLN